MHPKLQHAADHLHVLAKHAHDVRTGKAPLGFIRSSHWPAVEREKKKICPACIICGVTEAIQIHHVFPFHYCVALGRPDLELDLRNLVTVCETNAKLKEQNHHLLIAHLDDFKSANLKVIADSVTFKNMTAAQIKESPLWIVAKAGKLIPLNQMSDAQKRELRALMDRTLPLAA